MKSFVISVKSKKQLNTLIKQLKADKAEGVKDFEVNSYSEDHAGKYVAKVTVEFDPAGNVGPDYKQDLEDLLRTIRESMNVAGMIRVDAAYLNKNDINKIRSAGYEVTFSSADSVKNRGPHYIISSDEDSADEIIDALQQNGWDKISKNLLKPVKESYLTKALNALTEEKQIFQYNDMDAAFKAFNKMKPGHSMITKKDGKKTVYGIVMGSAPKGWEYFK